MLAKVKMSTIAFIAFAANGWHAHASSATGDDETSALQIKGFGKHTDEDKAIAQGGWDRHRFGPTGIEDQMLQQVLARASTGDPWSVLSAVDDFCYNQHAMMNIGPEKAAFVDKVIQQIQPKVVVEFGTYVGYSTVRWAAQLQNGARLWSIDPDPDTHVYANKLLVKAGLKDRVTLIQATAEDALPDLQKLLGGQPIDLLFIDHEKSMYLPDLERIEKAGLLRKGSVVAADDVLFFKLSDYLDHVRNSGLYSSTRTFKAAREYETGPDAEVDGVEISTYSGVR